MKDMFIAIDADDTHEPMCVSDSLEKVIEFLDEFCGYPDQADRGEIERYDCQVKIPYIGIIRYQNKGIGNVQPWESKFELYEVSRV
jgi:hypothetical protein